MDPNSVFNVSSESLRDKEIENGERLACFISEEDIQRLQAASTEDDRERIFRSLALHCHPDKFSGDSSKAAATHTFQRLLEVRDSARKAAEDQLVCSVDTKGCPPLRVLRQTDVVRGIAFDVAGGTMASCGDSGHLAVWKVHGWQCTQAHIEIRLEGNIVLATSFLPEPYVAATIGQRIEVWCLSNVSQACVVPLASRALSLAATDDGSQLAAGTENGSVQILLWCENQQRLQDVCVLDHKAAVDGVSWGLAGALLLASGGPTVSIWQKNHGHWRACASICFGDCDFFDVAIVGFHCAAGGTGGIAGVWDLRCATEDVMDTLVACSEGSSSGSSEEFDCVGDEALLFVAKHSDRENVSVNSVGLQCDGKYLATGGSDCRVVLWCMHSLMVVGTFHHHLSSPGGCSLCTASINAIQFSPDGKVLLAGGYDGMVTVWSLPQVERIVYE